MDIGDRIRKLREKNNLSQLELAKKLQISNSTLSQYESGARTPSDDIKLKIADFFDVSTDYLLGKTDNPRLTAKNERDVAKKIEELQQDLESQASLMFDGEEMDEQTRELLLASLAQVVISSKLRAKKKFTPKKYQK